MPELTLADGLSREYLLHHRLCPRAVTAEGVVMIAAAPDALLSGVDDIAFAYRREVAVESASPGEVDRLIERLTTRAERAIELARPDSGDDDFTTDVRDLANQPPVVRYVNLLVRDAYDAGASDSGACCARTFRAWDVAASAPSCSTWESRPSARSRARAGGTAPTRSFRISCAHRTITRPNEVWAMDITYIPMAHGFVYLAAVMDWASRRVLSWRVSVTLDSAFCIAALEEAIARYGGPTIMNTDQGAQFTSAAFTGVLLDHGIRISMDGRGCWRDNIFVERLWRSLKYEEVYLHGYDSVSAATTGIARYFTLYNSRRPHSSLTDHTPDDVFFSSLSLTAAA